jgi:hypothetical protein
MQGQGQETYPINKRPRTNRRPGQSLLRIQVLHNLPLGLREPRKADCPRLRRVASVLAGYEPPDAGYGGCGVDGCALDRGVEGAHGRDDGVLAPEGGCEGRQVVVVCAVDGYGGREGSAG